MFHDLSDTHDGPIIQEVFDSPRRNPQLALRDVTHNNNSRRNGNEIIPKEIFESWMIDPSTQMDAVRLRKMLGYLDYHLDQNREREFRNGSTESTRYSIDRMQSVRHRMRNQLIIAERALEDEQQEYAERKRQERYERSQIEMTRLRKPSQDTEDVERENSNRTRLHNSVSYHRKQASSSYQPQEHGSDSEDDEEYHRRQAQRQRTSEYSRHSQQNGRNLSTTNSTRARSPISPRPRDDDRTTTSSNKPRLVRGKNTVSKSKARRYRPGAKALMEIRKYQRSTNTLIAKAPFRRLIVEIIRDVGGDEYRVQGSAVEALQEIAEAFLVDMFEKASLLSSHAKRVTLMPADIQLYRRLCTKY